MNNNLINIFKMAKNVGRAIYQDKIVSHAEFMRHLRTIVEKLPESKYIINLCANRYLFMLVFIGSLLRKQICLLPPSKVKLEIENLKKEYKECSSISDDDIELLLTNTSDDQSYEAFRDIEIEHDQLACIVFTSGSTGKPKANLKHWGSLLASANSVAKALGINEIGHVQIVATVPAQHMFGFEMSIMLPLVTDSICHSNKPFFPEEVHYCLTQIEAPRILVTTPMHLKVCIESGLDWPEIEIVLCATAALERDLALQTEEILNTKVKEIYGCSEAGAIATREVVESRYWKLLPGYSIFKSLATYELSVPGYDDKIILDDNFKFDTNHEDQFELEGRDSDMIKIAGKRGSLGDLRSKICEISDVSDAVFFLPEEGAHYSRVVALVVAAGIESDELLKLLSDKIDPAFLPRPMIRLNKIPYNEIGKISKQKLLAILKQHRNKDGNYTECIGD